MRARPTVLFVTCAEVAGGSDDDRAVGPYLDALGLDLDVAVWDDPSVDWERADLTVLRSAWDYPARHHEFLAWARSVPRLANPFPVVEWSSDKHYLTELLAAGIPAVASHFAEPGDGSAMRAAFDEITLHGMEIVVKPAVGAGSIDAARFGSGDPDGRAAAHVASLHHSGRAALIQPYIDSIDHRGETSVVFLGGRHSHAIRKEALLDDSIVSDRLFKQEVITAAVATDQQIARAHAALALAPVALTDLLYARVDLLDFECGSPLVLELELVEPSLFLADGPGSASRFAAAIAATIGNRRAQVVD